jgi:Zn ribbon nucleic-acid-binding protein
MVPLDDSEFVCHQPCPSCGSSDANSLYTDGHQHCFSCGYHTGATGEQITSHTTNTRIHMDFTGDIIPLKTRSINEDTCKKFNVRYDSATRTIRFPYYTQAGSWSPSRAGTPKRTSAGRAKRGPCPLWPAALGPRQEHRRDRGRA